MLAKAREPQGRQGRERRAGPRTASPGSAFYNTSRLDFAKLRDDPDNIAANLRAYISGFSTPGPRRHREVRLRGRRSSKLDQADLLYLVVAKFAEIDLHPDAVSNLEMGYVFEELIRRFSELSNETAGEHFTPREVIRLMVNLLFIEDDDALTQAGHRAHAARPGLRHRRHALASPRSTCAS